MDIESNRFTWHEGDIVLLDDSELDQASKAIVAPPAIATPDPRDERERKLMRALAQLFAGLLPDITSKLLGGEMPSDAELTEAFVRVIQPQLAEAAVEEFERLEVAMGVAWDPAIVNQEALEWARTYTYDLVKGINETTRKTLQDAFTQFQTTPGMTRAQLEALIEPAFGKARASLISTTEITRSASEAQNLMIRQLGEAGIHMERVWNSLNDMNVCPLICAPLHRKPESEWKDRYPDGPPAHPGCRCSLTARAVE